MYSYSTNKAVAIIVSFWNCIIWNFLDVLRVSELITQACYYLKKYGQGFLPTLITCQLMLKHKSYPAWIYCMHTHLELWQMFNRQQLGVNFHTYNKLKRFFEKYQVRIYTNDSLWYISNLNISIRHLPEQALNKSL